MRLVKRENINVGPEWAHISILSFSYSSSLFCLFLFFPLSFSSSSSRQ